MQNLVELMVVYVFDLRKSNIAKNDLTLTSFSTPHSKKKKKKSGYRIIHALNKYCNLEKQPLFFLSVCLCCAEFNRANYVPGDILHTSLISRDTQMTSQQVLPDAHFTHGRKEKVIQIKGPQN